MKYLLLFSAFAVLTTGCRKNLDDVDDVHFDVSLEAETFKVGEPVRFHFSGNPDFIIFYSGEKGNDYAYKDTDAFWGIQFAVFSDEADEMKPKVEKWAASVTFED